MKPILTPTQPLPRLRARRLAGVAMAAACMLAAPATAQNLGNEPIRLIVGVPAGGTNDLVARAVAEKMQAALGQPVIVENKAGASQRIAVDEVKRAKPDGRTLVLATSGTFTIHPHIFPKLDYDPVADFTPIASTITFDAGIAASRTIPVTNIKEMIEWVKNHPNEASYGTPGAGTVSHFTGVLLGDAIDVRLNHIPYRGGAPAITDLVGGQVPFVINSLPDLVQMHRSGRIRILASSGANRLATLPDVPTLKESGVNVAATVTVGIFGPARMDPKIVDRLNKAIVDAVNQPDVRTRFVQYGLNPAPSSPDELARVLDEERKQWAAPIKASGYKAE